MSRYRFIAAERGRYSTQRLCQVLGGIATSFYFWHKGRQRAVSRESAAWETAGTGEGVWPL